jgi:hypothetical protein
MKKTEARDFRELTKEGLGVKLFSKAFLELFFY